MGTPVLLEGARVLDGRGGAVASGRLLFDAAGRIRVLARGEGAPAEARRVDVAGCTALPGLVDCHVHFCMGAEPNPLPALRDLGPADQALRAAEFARRTLRAGVTTVRDCGAVFGVDRALKAALRAGFARGPRVLSSGAAICMTGGHGHMFGREADGPDDVRKAAREQLKTGAEFIKLIATGGILTPGVSPGAAQLTFEELQAAVDEAKRAGRRAAAHAQGAAGILDAVRAGVDSIEHGIFLDAACIEAMRARGTFLVPTLVAALRIFENGEGRGIHPEAAQKMRASWETHRANMRRAHDAGLRIAMGTDAGTPFNPHGENAVELGLLVREAGLTPMEAIVAATSSAATLCGLGEQVGALADGYAADVLVVEGNPLEDVDLLARPGAVRHVFQAGVEVGLT